MQEAMCSGSVRKSFGTSRGTARSPNASGVRVIPDNMNFMPFQVAYVAAYPDLGYNFMLL
ncbi:hypothetical protein BpHYR1_042182 [Brachionus plicatilis]|uniref:Uncharacterized protein n=1 Tax=Brachionus plicatilis TaxID=10195 RepID=A0A3M7SF50_BRAPC|nr:hypothetical protein BpHYR1_042182 [Brachionus plicatilis]